MKDNTQFTNKINYISILVGFILLIIVVFASGCQLPGVVSQEPQTETVQLVLYVDPVEVPCDDLGNCLVVQYQPDGDLDILQQPIVGFEHELGYRYTLIVERTSVVGAVDSDEYPKYVLVQVVEREYAYEEQPTASPGSRPDAPTPIHTLTLEVTPTFLPTATPEATATMAPSPPPTVTELPTTTSTSTQAATPCNAARFIADVAIPDGTLFTPRASFTKIWRLQNVGSCTWTNDYDLVFISGDRMGGDAEISLNAVIPPGDTIDLALNLQAPREESEYRGYWQLRDGSGEFFGVGKEYESSIWVDIEVIEPDREYAFDFALAFCTAKWESEVADLPCPGAKDSADGFVRLLENPDLELRSENEPALWVHPNDERYGWIEGRYPLIEIDDGDHFRAWVGCLDGYQNCSLTFYLDYITDDGVVRNLGEWVEVYDGEVTMIDLDLSSLDGEDVRFILGTELNNKRDDQAMGFWFVPRLENVGD